MHILSVVSFLLKLIWNALIALIIGEASIIIGNFIPRRWIYYDKAPFKPFWYENGGKTYELLGIEHWKDKLPDISIYVNSVFPKKIEHISTKDDRYFIKFATETCVAEMMHVMLIFLSPVFYLLNWDSNWGIGVMIISIIANIPFAIVQRYNRPRLVRIINHYLDGKACEE